MIPKDNALYVDCDGTLVIGSRVSPSVRAYLLKQHDKGRVIMLWSARGKAYAERCAAKAKLTHIFAAILPKPAVILDDRARQWARWTHVIHPAALKTRILSPESAPQDT